MKLIQDITGQEKKISLTSCKNRYLRKLAYSPATTKLFCALAENRLSRTRKTEQKLFYARILIMLYLHQGRYSRAGNIEKYILNDPDLKSSWPYTLGDFKPSGLEINARQFRIIVDERVQNLSEYLLSDVQTIDNWLAVHFANLQGRTKFFFMAGSGPSPFNTSLNEAYLKVGHYRETPHDREIVIHAVVHEITHMYLRKVLDFSICQQEFGIRKFFDEGFAQLCGFRAAGALGRKRIHANTCARVAIAEGISTLCEFITEWETTLFQRRFFPLYQSALSFVAYLEQEFGYKTLIELFQDSSFDQEIEYLITRLMGEKFSCLLEDWAVYIRKDSSAKAGNFLRVTRIERVDVRTLLVEFNSDYPVYPEKDILVCDNYKHQLVVSSNQEYRYQRTGSFSVEYPSDIILNFVVAFDDKIQEFSMRPDL